MYRDLISNDAVRVNYGRKLQSYACNIIAVVINSNSAVYWMLPS